MLKGHQFSFLTAIQKQLTGLSITRDTLNMWYVVIPELLPEQIMGGVKYKYLRQHN